MKDFLITELKKLAEKQKPKLTEEEYQQELELIEAIDWPMKDRVQEVHIGSVVRLETNSHSAWYLVSPIAGGSFIQSDFGTLLVVSAFSGLGQEVMGKKVGELIQVQNKSYKVIELK